MIDLSCSVCLGGKFVGDIVITHVTEPETRRGLGGRGDVVEACGVVAAWRRGGVGSRRLFLPAQALVSVLSCLIVMKDCLESCYGAKASGWSLWTLR